MFETLISIGQQKQTYRNLLYLLMSVPLGIFYYAFIIIGMTCSALSIIAIGIPFMILFIVGWWQLAGFERRLAMLWLQVDIPPMGEPFKANMSWMQRFQMHINRAVTWKSLLYLFLKFPLGLLICVVVLPLLLLMVGLGMVAFVLGFLIAPFVYLYYGLSKGEVGADAVRRYLLVSATGYGWVLFPLFLLNVIAMGVGQFARLMLGMNDKSLRLVQATALAEQEHAKAERAEKSRSELIINVSHELRTPVASIRGHIESLLIACDESETATPPAETLRDYLTIVHRESIRLGSLVDDLLSVARAEANELRVNIVEVAADEVAEEVYQMLMPLAKRERQIVLIREVEVGLPAVKADRQRLLQVLLNLVRNAITYTPDGGIVSIGLKRADTAYLALTVSDTGIGIPPEDQERIFERFYRTDASRSRSSGGFGLGLAIVRDFVIAMEGVISVESTVSVGSCFQVLLRIAV